MLFEAVFKGDLAFGYSGEANSVHDFGLGMKPFGSGQIFLPRASGRVNGMETINWGWCQRLLMLSLSNIIHL